MSGESPLKVSASSCARHVAMTSTLLHRSVRPASAVRSSPSPSMGTSAVMTRRSQFFAAKLRFTAFQLTAEAVHILRIGVACTMP